MLVVFALTSIVAGFAVSMKVESRLAMNNNYDSEMEWIGRGGVEWARWAVGQQKGENFNLNQFWSLGHSPSPSDDRGGIQSNIRNDLNDIFEGYSLTEIPFGDNASATVTITDMERKWNVNALFDPRRPPQTAAQVMHQVFENMSITDQSLMSTISDSITDWIDSTPGNNSHRLNGAKNDYYMQLSHPYYCKQGYIDDISELRLIKGIRENPEIYYGKAPPNLSYYDQSDPNVFRRGKERPTYPFGLKDVFTVMGSGQININTADLTVLQTIPGMTPEAAQAIVSRRSGEDGQQLPFTDLRMINGDNMPGLPNGMAAGSIAQQYCTLTSRFFEVKVDAQIGGYRRTYHAVICRTVSPGHPNVNDPKIVKFYWD